MKKKRTYNIHITLLYYYERLGTCYHSKFIVKKLIIQLVYDKRFFVLLTLDC